MIIHISGTPWSGKTTLGKELQKTYKQFEKSLKESGEEKKE